MKATMKRANEIVATIPAILELLRLFEASSTAIKTPVSIEQTILSIE